MNWERMQLPPPSERLLQCPLLALQADASLLLALSIRTGRVRFGGVLRFEQQSA